MRLVLMAVRLLASQGVRGISPLFTSGRESAPFNGRGVHPRPNVVSRYSCVCPVVSDGLLSDCRYSRRMVPVY